MRANSLKISRDEQITDNGIVVIIPALNEEDSLGLVIGEIPRGLVSAIIVVDNGSTDETAAVARSSGAIVLREPRRGYGRACMSGVKYLHDDPPSIVVFLDADYSDPPSAMPALLQPLKSGEADLVLASRLNSANSKATVPTHVYFANKIFAWTIKLLYGLTLTDLGPFRAIKWDTLKTLDMSAQGYGWSSEMIVKAARMNRKVIEVPIVFRKRIGRSKISGNIAASLEAASVTFYNIFRYWLH